MALEIVPIEVLHDDVWSTVLERRDVEHANDLLALDLRRGARLAEEPLERVAAPLQARREQLDRDRLIEMEVMREQDDAHAAFAEQTLDPEAAGENIADADRGHENQRLSEERAAAVRQGVEGGRSRLEPCDERRRGRDEVDVAPVEYGALVALCRGRFGCHVEGAPRARGAGGPRGVVADDEPVLGRREIEEAAVERRAAEALGDRVDLRRVERRPRSRLVERERAVDADDDTVRAAA